MVYRTMEHGPCSTLRAVKDEREKKEKERKRLTIGTLTSTLFLTMGVSDSN
jgi:hypothetical protein